MRVGIAKLSAAASAPGKAIKGEATALSARPRPDARGKAGARGKSRKRKPKRRRGDTRRNKQQTWVAGAVSALATLAEAESAVFAPAAAVVLCAALHRRILQQQRTSRIRAAAGGTAAGGEEDEEDEEEGLSSEHSLLAIFSELVPGDLVPYLPPACRPSDPNPAAALPLPDASNGGRRAALDNALRCFREGGSTLAPDAVAQRLSETDVFSASSPREFGVVARRFVWLLLHRGRPLLARHLLRLMHRRPWRVPRRSRQTHTFLAAWAALRGRRGTDGVEEAARGTIRLLRRAPNSPAFATLLWYTLARLDSRATSDNKPVFRLLALYPRSVPVLLLAALLRLRAKREEEAVATLHAVLREFPAPHPTPHTGQAHLHARVLFPALFPAPQGREASLRWSTFCSPHARLRPRAGPTTRRAPPPPCDPWPTSKRCVASPSAALARVPGLSPPPSRPHPRPPCTVRRSAAAAPLCPGPGREPVARDGAETASAHGDALQRCAPSPPGRRRPQRTPSLRGGAAHARRPRQPPGRRGAGQRDATHGAGRVRGS